MTTAANGTGVPHPTDPATYVVSVGAGTVPVPEGMVYVPAGSFVMGTGATQTTATLDGYCIGRFEVTNAEWKTYLTATGRTTYPAHWSGGTFPAGKANHPVLYISLTEAQQYCAWISAVTGRSFAVPTSAQWEKAARGPNAWLYPGGNTTGLSYNSSTGVLTTNFSYNGVTAAYYRFNFPTLAVSYDNPNSAWSGVATTVAGITAYASGTPASPGAGAVLAISASGSVSGWVNHTTYTGFIYTSLFTQLSATGGNTAPVGSFAGGTSPYGCHDVSGNVWEWCDTLITATNGAEAGQVVNEIRGGSWYATATSCRLIGIGEGRAAAGKFNTVGLRLVLNLPADGDGDGMPDTWENANGLNSNTNDATLDLDGDGASNLKEYLAGTNPHSSASVLAISGSSIPAAGQFSLSWSGVAGKTYRFSISSDLITWTPLPPLPTTVTTGTQSATITTGGATQFFVRVEVVP